MTGLHPRARRGVEGARDAGRPHLEVLVRPAARGACEEIHPVDEFRLAQSRVGPTDVTEDDLFAGVRAGLGHGAEEAPVDDAGALQQHDDHGGRQDAEQHDRSPASSTRRGVVAGPPARRQARDCAGRRAGRCDRGCRLPAAGSRPYGERLAVSRAGDVPPTALGSRRGRPSVASRMTVSRSSRVQPFTMSGVTEPPPRRVSTTQSGRSSISHCAIRSQVMCCSAAPGRRIAIPSGESAMSKTSALRLRCLEKIETPRMVVVVEAVALSLRPGPGRAGAGSR